MMKNRFFIYALLGTLLCLAAACDKQKKEKQKGGFSVTGKIKGIQSDTVYLMKMDKNSMNLVDKTVVDKDGAFTFTGNVETPTYYNIRFDGEKSVSLILDNETFSFEADATQEELPVTVSNSKTNEDILIYSDFFRELMKERKELETAYMRFQMDQEKNQDSIQLVFDKLAGMEERRDRYTVHFIDSIFPSKAIFFIVPVLNKEPYIDYQIDLSRKLYDEYPDLAIAKEYKENMAQVEQQRKDFEEQEKNSPTAIGKEAPEITMSDPDGKIIKLSDLRGNYVLLDFWASWCGPCRRENPNLVNTFEQYKKRSFKVYSVSLDKDRVAWLKAIEKDNLEHKGWYHVSDLKHWQSEVVPLYGIQGIPFALLLDKEGKILARNLRGPALEAELKKLFD